MALVKKQTNSSRIIIIAAVILILGGAGVFLIPKFLAPSPDEITPLPSANRTVITEFGESILNDPRYQSLQTFGKELNVNAERDAGNPNPFQ